MIQKHTFLILAFTLLTGAGLLAQSNIEISFRDIPLQSHSTQINAYLLSNYLGNQNLVDSVVVTDGNKTILSCPQNEAPGLLTLILYANVNGQNIQSRFDFLYDGQPVVFNTCITAPKDSMLVTKSENNKAYFTFVKKKEYYVKYFAALTEVQKYTPQTDTSFFTSIQNKINETLSAQKRFLDSIRNNAGTSFASKYTRWYLLSEIYSNEIPQIDELKTTFLQRFDFSDPVIKTGDLLRRIVSSYLFLFKDDKLTFQQQEDTLITAIDRLMDYCAADDEMLKYIATTLQKDFKQIGMEKLIVHITENYLLPATCSDPVAEKRLEEEVERLKKLQTGKIAPNFEINKDGLNELYDVPTPRTLIIFWASWCSHCSRMLPAIYEAIKNRDDITVIAIALDDDTQEWERATKRYPGRVHIQAQGMWDDSIVRLYAVYATPTIYVLDEKFTILGKPKTTEELLSIMK